MEFGDSDPFKCVSLPYISVSDVEVLPLRTLLSLLYSIIFIDTFFPTHLSLIIQGGLLISVLGGGSHFMKQSRRPAYLPMLQEATNGPY